MCSYRCMFLKHIITNFSLENVWISLLPSKESFFDPRTTPPKESFWPHIYFLLEAAVSTPYNGLFRPFGESFWNDTSQRVTLNRLFKGVIFTLILCQFDSFFKSILLLFWVISTLIECHFYSLGLINFPVGRHFDSHEVSSYSSRGSTISILVRCQSTPMRCYFYSSSRLQKRWNDLAKFIHADTYRHKNLDKIVF